MQSLEDEVDRVAQDKGFSGVVHVDRAGHVELAKAYGMAHLAHQIPNAVDTQFGTASAVKGLTAVAVVSLIEDGLLELSTPARAVLGGDLPLIADDVTIEHLLAHRSGIGDYLDENADPPPEITDYMMKVPVHQLSTPEQYLAVLDGFPTQFPAGERFEYCNGAFVVLALIAERASGIPYHDLVHRRVCEPAGMVDSAFLRSDELPARAAIGYIEVDGVTRTNLLHLPVRGVGDGGIYTTVADVRSFWSAFFAGRLVSDQWVAEMVKPRSVIDDDERYGLGFWLAGSGDAVRLEGYDAGASFRSWHHPSSELTHTVISNTSEGAWPMTRRLRELLPD